MSYTGGQVVNTEEENDYGISTGEGVVRVRRIFWTVV